MDVEFGDGDLRRLADEADFRMLALDDGVVEKYRQRVQLVRAAPDERDFHAMKSLHYEKLKGNRSHQRAMRLNLKWRLIVEIREKENGTRFVLIVSIEDYH